MAGAGTFGEWLGVRRRALGLTRDELAVRADCAPITVEKIERGNRKPSPQVAHLLLTALHVPAHQHETLLQFARGVLEAADLEGALLDSPRPHLANLPVPPTPLLGREREAAAATGIMSKPGVRLLTLTGPGGVGKTRLALRVAEEAADSFPDGVYFVPLAPISDPNLVAITIAQAVGLPQAGAGSPLDNLKRELRDKRVLLLVDNFEQVVSAAPILSDLLAWCPQVKVLVTSREPLHLSGERQMVVPPLEVPTKDERREFASSSKDEAASVLRPSSFVQDFEHYASVRLFVERAEAVCDFTLNEVNARQVAEICIRLDGLPLAIELAAARTPLLTPDEMLVRLDSSLTLLTDGARDLPTRHRTLHAAIDWSYNLLNEVEQRLFSRIGAFVGGGTLDAIEAVCNAHGDLAGGVLEGIASLLDKSLIRSMGDSGGGAKPGERRFTMLETIREYSLERLEVSGEEERIRRHHAEYFLAMAEAARSEWYGQGKAAGLVRLEKDHNNLRDALSWALDHDELELALRVAKAMGRFWYERGHLVEGRRWLEECLTREEASPKSAPLILLAKARSELERLIMAQSDLANGEVLILESLPLYQALDDQECLAIAFSDLGAISAEKEDYPLALQHFEQSLAIWRDLSKTANVAVLLANMGYLAIHMGDYSRAIALCEESLQIQRGLKETWGVVAALIKLGLALLHKGKYDRAMSTLKEGMSVAREGGDKRHLAQALNYLGLAAFEEGDYSQAALSYKESLTVYRDLSNTFGIVRTLSGLAGLAGAQGETRKAVHLLGAADALTTRGASMRVTPLEQIVRQRAEEMARNQLDEAAWRTTWQEGMAMSMEQTIAYALEGAPPT